MSVIIVDDSFFLPFGTNAINVISFIGGKLPFIHSHFEKFHICHLPFGISNVWPDRTFSEWPFRYRVNKSWWKQSKRNNSNINSTMYDAHLMFAPCPAPPMLQISFYLLSSIIYYTLWWECFVCLSLSFRCGDELQK